MLFPFPSSFMKNPPTGGGPPRGTLLDAIVPSTCADLDATLSASYGGSGQAWANQITSPNDGAAQTDYDFFLGATSGASTDDPTFNGTAGDSAANWSYDGGDLFKVQNAIANTPTLNNLHNTTVGNTWWIATAFKTTNPLTSSDALWGSSNSNTQVGMNITLFATGMAILRQEVGSSSLVQSFIVPASTMTVDTDYLLIVSCDMNATTNNVRTWLNTKTKSEISTAWGTVNAGADNDFFIGTGVVSGLPQGHLPSGFLQYGFSCGNAFIDDATASSIVDLYNVRHGRTYA